MGIRTIIILTTIAFGGALVYQDVQKRVVAEEAARERLLQMARDTEISRCRAKAAELRNLVGEEPGLEGHLETGQRLLARLKGWSEQSRTNMPPDIFDVLRDIESQVRQIGRDTTLRQARLGQLEGVEAYIARLQDGAPIQIGSCL